MFSRRLPLVAAVALLTGLLAPLAAAPTSAAGPDTEATRAAKCHGVRATIVKGRKSNTIIGTNRRDVIVAGGGLDVVLGRGGRDVICGGRGSDLIDGGRRIDHLLGGRSRDQCFGPRREHRVGLHHSCEIHRLPIRSHGQPHRTADARTPELSLDAAAMRGHSFGGDTPVCSEELPPYVNFGNLYFTGHYANGQIAIRLHAFEWVPGGWNPIGTSGWDIYSVPADGQVYQHTVGRFPRNTSTPFAVVWEAWWGDSQGNWDPDTQTFWTPPSYIWRGYGIDLEAAFCS